VATLTAAPAAPQVDAAKTYQALFEELDRDAKRWKARLSSLIASIKAAEGLTDEAAQMAASARSSLAGSAFTSSTDLIQAIPAHARDSAVNSLAAAGWQQDLDPRLYQVIARGEVGQLTADFQKLSRATQADLTAALAKGVASGSGPYGAAEGFQEALKLTGPKAQSRAMMIARTTMARVYDVSSQQAYILAQEAGVLYGWKWSASGSACPTCSALHGTVFPPDADTYRHPNCTCRKVPISNSNPQAGTPYGTRVDPMPDAPPLSSVKLMESDSGWRTWSTAKGAKGPGPKNVGGKKGPRPGKKITPRRAPEPVSVKPGRAPDPKIQAAQEKARGQVSAGPVGRKKDYPQAVKALETAKKRRERALKKEDEAWQDFRYAAGKPDEIRDPLREKWIAAKEASNKAYDDIVKAKRRVDESFDLDSAEAARAAVSEVGAVARKEAERRLNVWRAENPDAPDALLRRERRRIYREIVEEHRSVTKSGDPPLNFSKVDGMSQLPKKYQGAVKDAFEVYPDEWQQAFLETFPDLRIGKVGRGYFSEYERTIGLSYKPRTNVGPNVQRAIDELGFDPYSVEEQLARVGVHEFGHGMERAVPGLLEIEHAWWLRRAGSNPRMRKKDGAYEVSNPVDPTDNWYTLKKYTKGSDLDRAYEIFTTGVENVLGDGGAIYLDDDLIDFVLGSLLTL
jgi:hypothetical protein